MRNVRKTGRLRIGTSMSRGVFTLWMATNVVTDSVQLYVDGVRQGVRSQNGGIVSLGQQHRFYIGSRGGTEYPFKGKITGRALAPSEFMTKRSSPPGVIISIK